MYTEKEIVELTEEEQELTEEELLVLLAALNATLQDLEKELRNFYQEFGKDGVVTYSEVKKWVSDKKHVTRLLFLNQTISDVFERGFDVFEDSFATHLRAIVKKECKFFNVDIDIDEVLNTLWGVDESNWLQRLNAHRSKWNIVINNDLKLSFLKRDSIGNVLTQTIERGESMETILKRLWRTESSAISSIARKNIFEKLGIKKYQFIHVDGCVCERCSDMHNRIFPIAEYIVGVTANPLHPNCNDITVPITE